MTRQPHRVFVKATTLEATERLGIHHEREGHEFTRAVKPLKMNQRFSA
jgi:hypothetical protein